MMKACVLVCLFYLACVNARVIKRDTYGQQAYSQQVQQAPIFRAPVAPVAPLSPVENLMTEKKLEELIKSMPNKCQNGAIPEPIWEGDVITEVYCRCKDNSYGKTCTENIPNPCDGTVLYAEVDRSIIGNYFVQCTWKVPYLMKCAPGTFWSQQLLTCVMPQKPVPMNAPEYGAKPYGQVPQVPKQTYNQVQQAPMQSYNQVQQAPVQSYSQVPQAPMKSYAPAPEAPKQELAPVLEAPKQTYAPVQETPVKVEIPTGYGQQVQMTEPKKESPFVFAQRPVQVQQTQPQFTMPKQQSYNQRY